MFNIIICKRNIYYEQINNKFRGEKRKTARKKTRHLLLRYDVIIGY